MLFINIRGSIYKKSLLLLLLFRPDRLSNYSLCTSPNFKDHFGGERGIRTLDTPYGVYTISNRALSTTQTSLLIERLSLALILICYSIFCYFYYFNFFFYSNCFFCFFYYAAFFNFSFFFCYSNYWLIFISCCFFFCC